MVKTSSFLHYIVLFIQVPRTHCGSFISLFCSGGALYSPDKFLAHTVVPSLRFFRWCNVWSRQVPRTHCGCFIALF